MSLSTGILIAFISTLFSLSASTVLFLSFLYATTTETKQFLKCFICLVLWLMAWMSALLAIHLWEIFLLKQQAFMILDAVSQWTMASLFILVLESLGEMASIKQIRLLFWAHFVFSVIITIASQCINTDSYIWIYSMLASISIVLICSLFQFLYRPFYGLISMICLMQGCRLLFPLQMKWPWIGICLVLTQTLLSYLYWHIWEKDESVPCKSLSCKSHNEPQSSNTRRSSIRKMRQVMLLDSLLLQLKEESVALQSIEPKNVV